MKIICEDDGDVFNPISNSIMKYGDTGRVLYATIGAGNPKGRGYLISDVNRRPNDINVGIKDDMINLNITDISNVNALFIAEQYYRDKHADEVMYQLLPRLVDVYDVYSDTYHTVQGYNSNSFIRGLLDAVEIEAPNPKHILFGWTTPLPSHFFGM
jgi:hypothetical protein